MTQAVSFLPSLTSDQARALAKLRKHPGGRNARAMLAEAQLLLMNDIRRKKISPAIRAKCVIALCKAEDMLRILSGKPLPGQYRPDLQGKQSKRKVAALLPMPEVPTRQDLPAAPVQSVIIDEVKAPPA